MPQLGTRDLTLSLAGSDVTLQISNTRLVSGAAEQGFVSFADAKAGGKREYRLQGTAVQDTDTGSIWDRIWTASGTTVAAILAPAGGTAASAAQPRLTGNIVIAEPDGDLLGGGADSNPLARFTFDFDFVFTAKPVLARA